MSSKKLTYENMDEYVKHCIRNQKSIPAEFNGGFCYYVDEDKLMKLPDLSCTIYGYRTIERDHRDYEWFLFHMNCNKSLRGLTDIYSFNFFDKKTLEEALVYFK